MTYYGEPAKNTTGHAEPAVYVCPGCGERFDWSPDAIGVASSISLGPHELNRPEWPGRVAAVREHLVTKHGWHHLPPSSDGTTWYFPEDYPA